MLDLNAVCMFTVCLKSRIIYCLGLKMRPIRCLCKMIFCCSFVVVVDFGGGGFGFFTGDR